MNLFEVATREKYRFPYRGMISVEDLWDLSMEQLDVIYRTLNKAKKANSEESLIEENAVDQKTANEINIVKYIFNYKKNEAEERRNAAAKALKKRQLLEILAKKQNDSLNEKSEEEIQKMIEELEE